VLQPNSQYGFLIFGITKKIVADYEKLSRAVFSCFHVQKKIINILASAIKSCNKKLHNPSFTIFLYFFVSVSKQATTHNLNPDCKIKETLREVLFHLFCGLNSQPNLMLCNMYSHEKVKSRRRSMRLFNLIFKYLRRPIFKWNSNCTMNLETIKKVIIWARFL
jgi:hypothetical protein